MRYLPRSCTCLFAGALLAAAACSGHAPREPTGATSAPLVWAPDGVLLTAPVISNGELGHSVAIDGTTIAAGARGASTSDNSVYVFSRGAGGWSQEQKLKSTSDPAQADDAFGRAVALDADTLVAGAESRDVSGLGNAGTAYVFVRSGAAWSEQQRLTAPVPKASDLFGRSVSVSGDSVAIGATGDDDKASSAGAVYVFVRTGTVWTLEQKITASDGAADDHFGASVSLDGDVLAVGAPDAEELVYGAGAVYVFERSGGVWSEQQTLVASNPGSDEQMGRGVALDGATLLAGAPGKDTATGASYVFVKSGAMWSEQQVLAASNAAPLSDFGWSVAVYGDTAVIGARQEDGGGIDAGAAYVFERSGAAWSETKLLKAPSPAMDTFYGGAVAVSGEALAVASTYDGAGGPGAGAVYAYARVGGSCAGPAGCATGLCVDGVCCDAACDGPCDRCDLPGAEGICTPVPTGDPGDPSCAPYTCGGASGACPTTCSVPAQCAPGYYCDGSTCSPENTAGQACAADEECQTGHCADGVCCDAACTGQCQACAEAGSVGQCVTVLGEPRGARPPCAAASCSEDVGYAEGRCEGGLACAEQVATPCKPYVCGATSCKTTCLSDAECAAGHVCLVSSQHCVPEEPQCDGEHTLANPDGSSTNCAPYRCSAPGSCAASCASTGDCVEGYVCSSAGKCEAPDEPTSDGGCGCAVPGRGKPVPWGLQLLPLALALLRLRGLLRRVRRTERRRPRVAGGRGDRGDDGALRLLAGRTMAAIFDQHLARAATERIRRGR